MKKMPLFLTVAAAALAMASCKKEDEQNLSTPSSSAAAAKLSKTDLLTTNSWRQTGLTVSSPAAGTDQAVTYDAFQAAKPSMLIKNAAYKADGTFMVLRGAFSSGKLAEPITGTWQLNAAGDSLTVTQQEQKRRFGVAELTASTLQLVHAEPVANGKVAISTATFSH